MEELSSDSYSSVAGIIECIKDDSTLPVDVLLNMLNHCLTSNEFINKIIPEYNLYLNNKIEEVNGK